MQLLEKYKGTLVFVLVGVLFGLLIGYQATVLFLSIVVTFFILKNKLSNKIFTHAYSVILTIIIYCAILQATILAAWLFDHNFPLNQAVNITAILLVIALAWDYLFKKERFKSDDKFRLFSYKDILSLAVALIIVLITFIGPALKSIDNLGKISIPAIIPSYMDTSLDDGNHMGRVNDHLKFNRGVIYKSDQQNNTVIVETISDYPPGWHSTNASLIKAVDPSIKYGGQTMTAYVITKFIWLFVLTFVFTRSIFDIWDVFVRPKGRYKIIASSVWLTGSAIFFSYFVFIQFFKEGFYPFLPLLLSLSVLIPLLLQLKSDKDTGKWKFLTLLPLALIVSNLTLSWFLIMPPVVLALIVAILFPLTRKTVGKIFRGLGWEMVWNAPLLVLVFLSILAQVLVITAPISQSFRVGVDTPGGIAVPSVAFYGVIFIGVVLFYMLQRKSSSDNSYYVTALLTSLLGFSLFIYLFQIITVHRLEYYYYKTLYTAIMIALPLCIVGWSMLIDLANKQRSNFMVWMFSLILVACLPLIIGVSYPGGLDLPDYVSGKRNISLTEDAFIYNSLSIRGKKVPNLDDSVFMYIPTDFGHNFVATNMLRSLEHVNNCDQAIMDGIVANSLPMIFSLIQSTCQQQPVTLITQAQYYQTIKATSEQYNLGNKFTIQVVD